MEKWQRGTYITSHRGKHSQVPAYSSVSLWAYRIQQQTCNIRLGRLHTAQLEGEPHTFVAIIDKYFIIAVFRQMVLTCLEDNNGFSISVFFVFILPLWNQSLPCFPWLIISTVQASAEAQTDFNSLPHPVYLSFVICSGIYGLRLTAKLMHLLTRGSPST